MKIRIFMTPSRGPATLLEAEIPEQDEATNVRAFTPPPGTGDAGGGAARAFPVDAATTASLRELAGDLRVAPFGAAPTGGAGPAVELVLSEGQAEARLQWWLGAPGGWDAADRLVQALAELTDTPMG